ncbi:Uncharacterised protein (plasmid) [Legionella adelaidensis]|uniref:Yip1 domain-containing protein n=1 Tax=Legionella adelaidensis TaxID=45056 RepID=A0A0W0R376_9GAMM|nr:hypothetical protein [Legionella adelaidensis]KTC65507.1 hypothetical protein Lade_0165 [Legionella adelaidensis]VEH84672.1 Uncharacterised protein [Legionella adelaidensis]
MWATLIKKYWQVTIFKDSPANTPHSLLLLVLVACLYLTIMIFQWEWSHIELQFTYLGAIFAAIALIVSYTLYTGILLKALGVYNRFVQTLTSLFACHFIIHIFAIPLLLFMPVVSTNGEISSPLMLLGILYLLATLILTAWQFILTVYIYKEALSLPYFPAVLASVGLLATNILTISFWR